MLASNEAAPAAEMLRAHGSAAGPTRVDTALAVARALLALAAALRLGEAPRLAPGWDGLSALFVAVYPLPAMARLAVSWWRPQPPPETARWWLHAADVLWAGAASNVGSGAVGFAALLFVVFAAGQTWGVLEAVVTAIVGLGLASPAVLDRGTTAEGLHSIWILVARGLALLAVAGVAGWLSSEQRRERARGAIAARAFRRTQAAHGFEGALSAALQEARSAFVARHVALVTRDVETGGATLWCVDGAAGAAPKACPTDLRASEAGDWLFPAAADAWHAERRAAARWKIDALDADGRPLHDAGLAAEEHLERLAERHSASRLTGLALHVGGDFEGRLLLFDAALAWPHADELRFAQGLVRELGEVVYARFVLGRIRSRIGALERARVARELHDGTIQSLVSVEMQVDVLRRQAEHAHSPLAADLARIQKLLRSEVLDVRDTMERLRPPDVEPTRLVGFLDEKVARFERDSGIHALFDCKVEDVDLAPDACREVARIVWEALHNVRKHSGARNVLVRLLREPAGWRLVVDDDGRGFPFGGRLSHAQLDAERKGPYVIKERVRSLGGELSIDTAPGRGARLDIFLPHRWA